ncbi:hypothetical protein H4R34_006212 [Dimargaris verticillata]|uniref:Aminotransferase class I/classII large domain-containing protein n=1 Tax=Dimargaris verticillata TaxID=2761393 RepID=A0A9W8AUU2_9FUNG|nr:hypothetical protein H4R34_006212 [Dimargaris verticillata]
MQPWLSFNFRADSMTSQADYVQQLFTERGISVFVIHSWTKLWSCTGIRLGSIVCPTAQHCQALKAAQVPWSVNCAALAFLSQVVKDDQYMADTWALTPTWRKHIIATLSQQLPQWLCYGEPFLSWVWIDTGSEDVAQKAVALARGAGVPVRNGLPGYSRPTFVRVAVREPSKFAVLLDAWRDL